MPTEFEKFQQAAASVDRQITTSARTGGVMSQHRGAFTKALNALADHIVKPGQMLQELERDRDRYPADFYRSERERLVQWARSHDGVVTGAIGEYLSSATADARKLRVQAEADRPAAERTAEMLERQQILALSPRAGDLLSQAAEALAADRPRRAAFLVDVARSVGGTVLGDLPGRVEDALDADDATRAQARAIEEEAEANFREFEVLRFRALVAAGIGLAPDGSAGDGSSEAISRANVARKLAAFATGGDFSDAAAATEGGAA